jgi:purine-nucleoside phosphorylase
MILSCPFMSSLPQVVVIQDHLALANLTGMNPLLGPTTSPSYPRFLPLSDAYSPSLRRLAFLASHYLSLPPDALAEGTYAWVSGPTYESPAEGRFLRNAGADVVGMSTVPEVLAAREEGLKVMVLSLVTNAVVIPEKYRNMKEEVEAEVRSRVKHSLCLLRCFGAACWEAGRISRCASCFARRSAEHRQREG